jgi:ABC-type multidrug transport system fused ATPase/permease subunit
VSFRYIDQKTEVMENLSFEIKENSFVAIMGESGSGKSTILNLIFRLYDPYQGSIEIDGIDIKKLKFDFRKDISFVSQSPYLFNGTVLENLKFGFPDAKFEDIE